MLVAQLGARRHYAIPRILHDAGMLERFCTDTFGHLLPARLMERLIPNSWIGEPVQRLLGRRAPGVPAGKIRFFQLFGLKRSLRSRRAITPVERLRAYLECNREFCRLVTSEGLGQADAVYVFNGAGLEIMEHAKSSSLGTILDQTAAPWAVEETLLAEERERWPGWEFEGTTRADWEPLAERERREWELADVIVCGSEYVRESIRSIGGPDAKCVIVPYGIDTQTYPQRQREPHDGPLRVLFVGTIQLRKGIQYLMEAAKLLKPGTTVFRAVGAVRVSAAAAKQIGAVIEPVGAVPGSLLQREYDWADVLVAPSLSEGSANVCYEALACGLPVITTPNAGSVVRDGIDGFIVPIRSAKAIADRISALASDGALLPRLSQNAIQRAADFSRQKYGERLIAAMTQHAKAAQT